MKELNTQSIKEYVHWYKQQIMKLQEARQATQKALDEANTEIEMLKSKIKELENRS